MAKQQLVLAFFENEAAADAAVNAVKQWDKASKEIKLGAIGVLVKDDKGKIKTHKLGARRTKGGAVLFGLAALLTGGMAIGVGVVGGAVAGGIIGALFHKGLKMSDKEKEQLNKELPNDWRPYYYLGMIADREKKDSLAGRYFERVFGFHDFLDGIERGFHTHDENAEF